MVILGSPLITPQYLKRTFKPIPCVVIGSTYNAVAIKRLFFSNVFDIFGHIDVS